MEEKISGIHPIFRTILLRLGLGLITVFAFSIIIFSCFSFLPGDFATEILGQSATKSSVAALRSELGLDKHPIPRYFEWLSNVFQGDFGSSFSGRSKVQGDQGDRSRQVVELIIPRLKNTLFLTGVSALVAIPLALLLGISAALYRNSYYDRSATGFSLVTVSSPEFFTGYIFILLLATLFPVFPTIANVNEDTSLIQRFYLTALPVFTLTLVTMGHMMRMTRSAIINILSSEYIEMAKLSGATRYEVIVKHALPNAWAPIAQVITINLAYMLIGSVVVEFVFNYQGIGRLMVGSVYNRDIPVVQACALIFASTYVILNLLADLIGIISNPRLLYPK